MLKKSLQVIVLCLVVLHSQAQDQHFSQFFNSPQNLNPALSGVFNGDLRIAANHKNQWRTLPVPYRTYSISADGKLPLGLKNDYVCAGILFNNDKSGDGSFITNQAGISLAYLKKLNKDSSSFLSFGIQPSLISRSINLSKLSFDNQFSDGAYNSAITNGENFSRTNFQF
ncbi:MAG: PorP/SprF family type IX secretion system membrane protein [Bacteroidetes bacterium]|nr:PorP/SprF family type IX secretion system membrane protein [Bacteroidota bacterium]